MNLAMLTQLDAVGGAAMPTLALAAEMSPVPANIMAAVLLCMIYNTAAGMLYSFTARVSEGGTKRFKAYVFLSGIGGFALSFVGFVNLVGTLYPITGYLGFALIGAVVIYWFRKVAGGAGVSGETVSKRFNI